MSDPFERSDAPRAEDIELTPANEQLRQEFLAGVEQALTSDFAHTFEVTDQDDRSSSFRLPNPKHLTRAVILKLDGLGEREVEASEDSTEEESTPTLPLLYVTVEATVHSLDKEKAEDITLEEASKLPFVWPDSVSVTLFDNTYNNISTRYICWQRGDPERGIPGSFFENGNKRAIIREVNPESPPTYQALGLRSANIMTDRVGITKDGMSYLDDLRVVNEVLKTGSVDFDASRRLVEQTQASDFAELLTASTLVIRNSLPHFRNLIEGALSSPHVRDMIAWQQYCEKMWPEK